MKKIIGKSRIDGSLIYEDYTTSSGKKLSVIKNPWYGLTKAQMLNLQVIKNHKIT
jgi:hypothetical protein